MKALQCAGSLDESLKPYAESVGLIEFLHHQPREALNNARHSIHTSTMLFSVGASQRLHSAEVLVSVMRSDSGQGWMVNVSLFLHLIRCVYKAQG